MTATVNATDFCRNFGSFQRQVQREPIEVRSHGRTTGYFVSPEVFEKVEHVLAQSRQAYHPRELPEHLKAAIRESRMDRRHKHLNALLDDE